MIETILLIVSALCVGYAASFGAARILEEWRRKRQEIRVKNILEKKAPSTSRGMTVAQILERTSRYIEGGLSRLLEGHGSEGYRAFLEKQLRRSGQSRYRTPERVLGMQVSAALIACLVFGLLTGGWGALIGFGGGIALPLVMLSDEARRREERILRELPNAMEAFSLCVEAGLTLDQAWAHYLSNAKSHPWKEELALVVQQSQAGSSRKEALAALSQRLELTDVALFASSVTHAEKAGTGVGATLRRLGATLRDKQTQRAEKAVQELPVKLLLPLLLCVMPVTLLVLFAPILLRLLYG
jgi:tight adherence protein C